MTQLTLVLVVAALLWWFCGWLAARLAIIGKRHDYPILRTDNADYAFALFLTFFGGAVGLVIIMLMYGNLVIHWSLNARISSLLRKVYGS